jgi:hypothetical protein
VDIYCLKFYIDRHLKEHVWKIQNRTASICFPDKVVACFLQVFPCYASGYVHFQILKTSGVEMREDLLVQLVKLVFLRVQCSQRAGGYRHESKLTMNGLIQMHGDV